MLLSAKESHFRNKIRDADPKQLFRVVDSLSHVAVPTSFPEHTTSEELANRFADFFRTKIERIREKLNVSIIDDVSVPSPCISKQTAFSDFRPMMEDEIVNIIKQSNSSSCQLDPIPTRLLKRCCPVLSSVIMTIINLSLHSGHVPTSLKCSIISPRLKKSTLSSSEFNNFRPIANLSYVSKVLERAAVLQLQEHLEIHTLHAPSQSAYRKGYSVETATVRVHNDVTQALDRQEEVIIVLIDFSSAFDTIDHATLFNRLTLQFGISGNVLNWIKSYLTDRSHTVSVLNSTSCKVQDSCGVPQGSVIGPLLFILYTTPIHHIIKSHGLQVMMYADDVQIYSSFHPRDRDTAISRINACVRDIRSWSTRNMLALNDSKTEVLHFVSKFATYDVPSITIKVGEMEISPSREIRNLGAIMDTHMTMRPHVKKTCQLAMAAASNIGRIRRCLDVNSTNIITHAFVTSRLDNFNSLLCNIPQKDLYHLQRIQNISARITARTKSTAPTKTLLQKLHWLPVDKRIKFKLLLLTYKALHGLSPTYISELIKWYNPRRTLRSQNQLLLQVPSARTQYYGSRSFAFTAPTLWNALPLDVRTKPTLDSFKAALKHHLFISQ